MNSFKMSLLLSAAAFVIAGASHAFAAPAPLEGKVTSAKESAMEGVLVSAKRDGSNVSRTVVSDDKGHYAFPAGRLEPGHYRISIRAAGYILNGPRAVDVTANGVTADVRLNWRRIHHFDLSLVGQNLLQPHHAEFGRDLPPIVQIRRNAYVSLLWKR